MCVCFTDLSLIGLAFPLHHLKIAISLFAELPTLVLCLPPTENCSITC